jgi:formylglycine-generating enzyme required for sulfatase activity
MVPGRDAAGGFCIDAYEAHVDGDYTDAGAVVSSAAGAMPSVGVTWDEARGVCTRAGMHLCTSAEWEDACDGTPGPGGRAYPGGEFRRGDCPILGKAIRDKNHLWASGSWPGCHTAEGVWDMLGNAWEWTDPEREGPDGQPLIDKRGGGHYTEDAPPCSKGAVGTHPRDFRGTIGFRCCTRLEGLTTPPTAATP